MSGSKNWFKYTDDSDVEYSVFLDESNSEATVGGIRLFLNRTANHQLLRKGTKLRYANAFLTTNPAVKRKFYIGNPLAIPQVIAGGALTAVVYANDSDDSVTPISWTITSYRGEQSNITPAVSVTSGDTGLIDGDPSRDA
jgi:hypothetical protein